MSQSTETDTVLATLDDYARAYCAKDIDALMSVFDDSDDISVIGTGADELCSGRDQVRDLFLRNFSEAQADRFEWHWTHVSVDGDQAVVAIALTIHLELAGDSLQVPIRWTVALRNNRERWRWIHRHASTPASDQSAGQAYPQGKA
jgi:ketosteroid isomerase-like protein